MKWRTILFPILETAIPDVPLSATVLCALIIHKWVDYDDVYCIFKKINATLVSIRDFLNGGKYHSNLTVAHFLLLFLPDGVGNLK